MVGAFNGTSGHVWSGSSIQIRRFGARLANSTNEDNQIPFAYVRESSQNSVKLEVPNDPCKVVFMTYILVDSDNLELTEEYFSGSTKFYSFKKVKSTNQD